MRMCIFCSNKTVTIEDAWPLWLMNRFPATSNSFMDAERGGNKLGNWNTTKPKLQVKWLCASCNNGWMSRLEDAVKPILESIFNEKLKAIDESFQLTLARWAVKTAMVLESIDPNRSWFYSDGERQMMRTAQSLPSRTSVWIAKCINQPNIYSAAMDLKTTPGNDGFHAYATTMAFGSIAFQVVSIKTPISIHENVTVTYDVTEGPWDQTIVRVWPTTQKSIVWPPNYGLNNESGLEALANRLSPSP
jgi:hypothetical protein